MLLPDRALWAAVLLRAINDLIDTNATVARDACEFLFKQGGQHGFWFEQVCGMANVGTRDVRRGALRTLEASKASLRTQVARERVKAEAKLARFAPTAGLSTPALLKLLNDSRVVGRGKQPKVKLERSVHDALVAWGEAVGRLGLQSEIEEEAERWRQQHEKHMTKAEALRWCSSGDALLTGSALAYGQPPDPVVPVTERANA